MARISPVPLTLEEHRELGRELVAANAKLQELYKVVEAVYGPNNQATFTFLKVAENLERLLQDLQAQAAADHPGFSVNGLYKS